MEFVMGAKAQQKLDVISKVEQGKIPRKQARQILGKSERTLERYLARYRKNGVVFIRHGNQGRRPRNRINEELKQKVLGLVRNKYHDFNMAHCLEKLRDDEKLVIRAETFRKWCHEIRHVKRRKRRRAQARHHERKGLFEILYVDRAGIFGGHKRMEFSQFKRALEELGIHILYAQSPEAKGRVERMFQTLQDRMIPEMRMKNITTLTLDIFIPKRCCPALSYGLSQSGMAYKNNR